jgi:hypothetical protein
MALAQQSRVTIQESTKILGDIRGQIAQQGIVAPTPDVTKVAFGKSFGRGGGGRFGRSFRRG